METPRQHGAVGADQAIHPVRLARTPLRIPESQQGLEVPVKRLRCGDGYPIFTGRVDLLQEAADLLPRVGAEGVEIAARNLARDRPRDARSLRRIHRASLARQGVARQRP